MSTYYLTDFSCAEAEIGFYPQCVAFEKGLTDDDTEIFYTVASYYNRDKEFYRPPIQNLNGLRLHGWAKKTDVLSQVFSKMMLLDKKALNLIEKFNLGEYEVIPATVIRRKVALQYYYLYYLSGFSDYVDISKCEFQSEDSFADCEVKELCTNNFEKTKVDKVFFSFEEYFKWQREDKNRFFKTITPTKIVLNGKCPRDRDIFRIPPFSISFWFFSERLKKAFEENKITGLTFIQPVKVVFE